MELNYKFSVGEDFFLGAFFTITCFAPQRIFEHAIKAS